MTLGSTGYSTGKIEITAGSGRIAADEPFVLTMSGYSRYESYLTLVGTTYSQGASYNPSMPETKVQAIPVLSWFGLLISITGFAWLARKRFN